MISEKSAFSCKGRLSCPLQAYIKLTGLSINIFHLEKVVEGKESFSMSTLQVIISLALFYALLLPGE